MTQHQTRNAPRTARLGRRACLFAIPCVAAWYGLGCKSKPGEKSALTLFGAATTTTVMDELAHRHSAATGTKVRTSFASSGTLARQIDAGAPADVFVSADESWMDFLAENGRLEHGTRADLLGNRLVLIAPASRPFAFRMGEGEDLPGAFKGRIALAEPAHAPAGKYAQKALEAMGWWRAMERRVLPAKDVRAALAAVETGAVDAGIVYATDAKVTDRVAVIGTFPESSHPTIRYPIAVIRGARPGARALHQFLLSKSAAEVYRSAGFTVLFEGGR